MKKMYDFGKLGKWSLSTLKANMESDGYWTVHNIFKRISVDSIETNYRSLFHNINYRKKVFFMNIRELGDIMHNIDINNELDRDYKKYQVVMEELLKEKEINEGE